MHEIEQSPCGLNCKIAHPVGFCCNWVVGGGKDAVEELKSQGAKAPIFINSYGHEASALPICINDARVVVEFKILGFVQGKARGDGFGSGFGGFNTHDSADVVVENARGRHEYFSMTS